MSWWILAFLLVGVLWYAFRKSGVAPKLILLLVVPFLLVILLISLKGPNLRPNVSQGSWLKSEERSAIDLSGQFTGLDGRRVSLSSYSGSVLFLNVWATWCGPCRQEMPSMADLYRDFSGKGLSMVAVSNEDLATVRQYAAAQRLPFTVMTDPDNVLSERFGINGIPTTFIVDKKGQLVYQHVGSNDWNTSTVRSRIQDLLNDE